MRTVGRLLVPALGLVAMLLTSGSATSSAEAFAIPDLLVVQRGSTLTAPDSIAAGWVRLRYLETDTSGHNLVLFALPETANANAFLAALDTMRATPRPGIARGGLEGMSPKDTVSGVLNLAPGRYLLACLHTASDKKRHANHGERRWLKVVAAKSVTTPPVAAMKLTLSDFAFSDAPQWRAGAQFLQITNKGQQDHLVIIEKLHAGITMQKWIEDENGTTSDPLGGMTRLGPGQVFYLEGKYPPGEYMLLCLIPDGPSGKSHLELGMVRQFKVPAK